MRIVSYPPFIVFFDTIAVILFFLILNQNKTIDIQLIENRLFDGAELIYKKHEHYHRLSGEIYERKQFESEFYYLLECKARILECKNAMHKYKTKDVFILLPDSTYNDISELTFLALEKKVCSKIKYSIAATGRIDYVKLQKDNPCLSKLSGFNELVDLYREY